jgi:hypothetical protein
MMNSSLSPLVSGADFYRKVLDTLNAASIDFLLGGAFALHVHTGIERDTKDFDLMLRACDVQRALEACRHAGFRADIAYSHWIAKVHRGEHFIDLIYRAGNGLCEVDDEWFAHAREAEVMGRQVRLCPPEEMIWQKAYVMERERYDGADVMHLLRSSAATMDWERLIARFAEDWRVLLSYLILFGFVYPQHQKDIPPVVIERLFTQLRDESAATGEGEKICRGTLLSRGQYLPDVERWGYTDARLDGRSKMTAAEMLAWTTAIDQVNRLR